MDNLIDAVLRRQIEMRLAGRATPREWIETAFSAFGDWSVRDDLHLSTMGRDTSNNFREVADPFGIKVPMRLSLFPKVDEIQVRELPIGPGVTYVHYDDPLEWDEGDDHEIWRRPLVLVEGLALPDTVIATLGGLPLSRIVETGNDDLDALPILTATNVPSDVVRYLRHGTGPGAAIPPSLVVRLDADAVEWHSIAD